jgi:hypothetical protein
MESRKAAEERQLEELRRIGPRPEEAIQASLKLIDVAGDLYGWPLPEDPITAREDAEARERWARIRAYYGKP